MVAEKTEGVVDVDWYVEVVDVDWYVEDDQPKRRILVDREKAALNGITDEDVAKLIKPV